VEPGQFSGFEVGKNVKLRLVVAGGDKKITCHAKIDWVTKDESTDEYYVGFGNLSLTDEEFQVLQSSFIEDKGKVLEFGVRVRDRAREAKPYERSAREIMVVLKPVSIIGQLTADVSFSEFVTNAVRAYLKS
jgi:hypothetical protein